MVNANQGERDIALSQEELEYVVGVVWNVHNKA